MNGATVAIVGASGLVGSRVLHHLLERDDVIRVVALGRRPLPVMHEKLVSGVVELQSSSEIAAALPEQLTIAVCCLGTTMKKAGSKEAFRAVDYDAAVAFAAAARDRGARHFLLVSSLGANARSSNFYQRTKGEVEDAVARLGYPQLTVVRPSLIDDEGQRQESRMGERVALSLARALFAIVGRTSRYAPISADAIARALVRLAFDPPPERLRIIESEQLHALGRRSERAT
jgi:uncharacterized protein YbjT (DUF2867 family)